MKSRKISIDMFEASIHNDSIRAIYWDFESFLTAVNCSLDALARVA